MRIMERTNARRLLLPATILLIPFLSWGRVPLLTGVFGLLVAVIVLLRIGDRLREGGKPIPFTGLWIPFAVIFCLSVLHIPFSPVPYSSLLFTVHLSLAWVFYLLLLDGPLPDPGDPVLIWILILIPWVVVQVLAGSPVIPSGPFLNPNYFATVLLTCLGWTLGSLIPANLPHRRTALLLVGALVVTAGLVVIGSRSAGLAILGLWGLYILAGKGRLRVAGIIVIALVFVLPTTLKHRVTDQQEKDPHAFSRVLIWKSSFEMGLDHPILGVGPNLYYEHAPRYAFPTKSLPVKYGRIARKPHNEYLRSWAEGGVLGVSGVILFLVLTSRLMLGAWRRGLAGPVLAVGVILFQALFHDLNEVFALTALGAWWLAQISAENAKKVEMPGRPERIILTGVGGAVLLFSLWLNLDVSSRIQWLKGQQLMAADVGAAVRVLGRASTLNPLLPGLSRDLAGAQLAVFRKTGVPEDLERAGRRILKAQKLNRLDTVPLRLEAALRLELAAKVPERSRDSFLAASGTLVKALELEPHNALIMLSLADTYLELGQSGPALEMIERALKTEPNYLEAHRRKILFLAGENPGRVDAAREELEKARERAAGYRPHGDYEGMILR